MSDQPFLDRWSRLKTESAVEPQAAADADLPVADAEGSEAQDAAPPPEDLPDIETLGPDSDYTPFMRENVPEELRRLALRRLWRSNPIFANLDGLNDYDENFSLLYKAGNVVQSLYQVGKGMPGAEPEPEAEMESDAVAEAAEGAADGAEPKRIEESQAEIPVEGDVAPQNVQFVDLEDAEEDV